jgi:hypothetical protein
MKSFAVEFIFHHSSCSELAPTGFSNRANHDLGAQPARIACIDIEIGQRCRIADQDILREFGSTGFGQLVKGIIQQVDVYQRGD